MNIKIISLVIVVCFVPVLMGMNQNDLNKQLLETIRTEKDIQCIKKLVKKGADINSPVLESKRIIPKISSYLKSRPTIIGTIPLLAIMKSPNKESFLRYFITQKIDLETIYSANQFNQTRDRTNCLVDATYDWNRVIIQDLLVAGAHVKPSGLHYGALALIENAINNPKDYKSNEYAWILKTFDVYTIINTMPKFSNEEEKYNGLITYLDQFIPFNRILFSLFTNDDLKKNGLYGETSKFNTHKFKKFIKEYDNKISKQEKTLNYKLYNHTFPYVLYALLKEDIIEIVPTIHFSKNESCFDFDPEEPIKELIKCHAGKQMSNFLLNCDCIFIYK